MRRVFRALAGVCLLLSAAVLWKIGSVDRMLPEELCLTEGQQVCLCGGDVELCPLDENTQEAKLWGVIRLGEVKTREVDRLYLAPCGQPFGIKLLTEGVVVVSTAETAQSGRSPGELAGIRAGDVLLSVDGAAVSSATDIARVLKQNGGHEVCVKLERGGTGMEVSVTPDADADGDGSLGLLVRDSSAGIGTMTWYDPASGAFGGLGHGVCDVDTGVVLPLRTGQAVSVEINGVNRARAGAPGELTGVFESDRVLGELTGNSDHGVFGVLATSPTRSEPIPVAFPQEAEEGPAQIWATIHGREPKLYDIVIERIDLSDPSNHRDFVVRVTDDELLQETGGIVQGMSGSPVIQNGMFVGAVTHVFVNTPEMGYGIFLENMIENAGFSEAA